MSSCQAQSIGYLVSRQDWDVTSGRSVFFHILGLVCPPLLCLSLLFRLDPVSQWPAQRASGTSRWLVSQWTAVSPTTITSMPPPSPVWRAPPLAASVPFSAVTLHSWKVSSVFASSRPSFVCGKPRDYFQALLLGLKHWGLDQVTSVFFISFYLLYFDKLPHCAARDNYVDKNVSEIHFQTENLVGCVMRRMKRIEKPIIDMDATRSVCIIKAQYAIGGKGTFILSFNKGENWASKLKESAQGCCICGRRTCFSRVIMYNAKCYSKRRGRVTGMNKGWMASCLDWALRMQRRVRKFDSTD